LLIVSDREKEKHWPERRIGDELTRTALGLAKLRAGRCMIIRVRRLGRWLFYGLAGLSLMLCLATAAMWVGSKWWTCGWSYRWKPDATKDQGRFVALDSDRGALMVISCFELLDHHFAWRGGFAMSQFMAVDKRPLIAITGGYEPQKWYYMGIVYSRQLVVHDPHIDDRLVPGSYHTQFYFPYWMPTVLFAILPGFMSFSSLRRRLRRRYRRRHGLCIHCGYDLRATPKRCPECGAEAE
jgi:hypothetical protein